MVAPRLDDPLSADQLQTLLDYHPKTGLFLWRPRTTVTQYDRSWNTRYAGTVAGYQMPKGYVQIMVDGRKYLAHRLAWLWMTGVWPDGEVDHWDTNGANNAWANLRAATRPQQLMNASKRSDNTSGYKGVSFDPRRGTWYARVESNGRKQWIGSFPTPEAAKLARDAAADLFHGDFARNE